MRSFHLWIFYQCVHLLCICSHISTLKKSAIHHVFSSLQMCICVGERGKTAEYWNSCASKLALWFTLMLYCFLPSRFLKSQSWITSTLTTGMVWVWAPWNSSSHFQAKGGSSSILFCLVIGKSMEASVNGINPWSSDEQRRGCGMWLNGFQGGGKIEKRLWFMSSG